MCCVRDYGRGIPLGKVIECVSQINTGAKYNDDVFQFSVGLNGVGTKAVNALSSHFLVRSHRDGEYVEARFHQGKLQGKRKGKHRNRMEHTSNLFPILKFSKNIVFKKNIFLRRIWHYAYLNTGLHLILMEKQFNRRMDCLILLNAEVTEDDSMNLFIIADKQLEFAFLHTQSYGESYFSFVNGQYTSDGGTHLSAFREGILKGVNEFAKKNFQGVDVREGIVGTILVQSKRSYF